MTFAFPRPLRWLPAIAIFAVLLHGCGGFSDVPLVGRYRAVLELPGGELPFGLELAQEDAAWVIHLLNGAERIRVSDVEIKDGILLATFPGFENTLRAQIGKERLDGDVTLVKAGGKLQVIPFSAEYGDTWRFFEQSSTDNADVSGRWAVVFAEDEGRVKQAVGEFEQSHDQVTGTFLTATGDHRFLVGQVRGDELYLSTFDGAHAYLYKAEVDQSGGLVGDFWSGLAWHESWTARRDPAAALDESQTATALQDDSGRFAFSFPDLDGTSVSLDDARFAGKVVIVTLVGSWCPNCHDEAAFLAPLYDRYRAEGLEIVALMFEHFGDFAQAVVATQRFRQQYDIRYTTLIAGISDKQEAGKVLPQLTGVYAFPTTIFVDRQGTVRKIHAGFAGPAAPREHEQLTSEFTALIEDLLAERTGTTES